MCTEMTTEVLEAFRGVSENVEKSCHGESSPDRNGHNWCARANLFRNHSTVEQTRGFQYPFLLWPTWHEGHAGQSKPAGTIHAAGR